MTGFKSFKREYIEKKYSGDTSGCKYLFSILASVDNIYKFNTETVWWGGGLLFQDKMTQINSVDLVPSVCSAIGSGEVELCKVITDKTEC